jgi:hypothetical protein
MARFVEAGIRDQCACGLWFARSTSRQILTRKELHSRTKGVCEAAVGHFLVEVK